MNASFHAQTILSAIFSCRSLSKENHLQPLFSRLFLFYNLHNLTGFDLHSVPETILPSKAKDFGLQQSRARTVNQQFLDIIRT
jgi:hypothetical protein